MLSRRTFFGAAAVPLLKAQQKSPTFIYILADDHAGYVLGCDGNRKAETPNLDQLASEGTRFSANYCNSPVCTPSRQSFLTGQLPHSAGVTVLRTSLDPQKPTLAKQLKQAEYKTAVFGKMHFNRPGSPGLYGFDHMFTEPEIQKAWSALKPAATDPSIPTKKLPWQPFKDPARIWLNADNLPYPRTRGEMRSAFQLQQVERYMESQAGSGPLALWVSFLEPHSPFDFPVEERPFRPSQFDVPKVGKEDAWQIPLIFRNLGEKDKQGITAAYYNSVRYLDQNIGRLFEILKKHGRFDNAYVVYMADHGYCLGHHGRFEKHCGYDPALRVPLIMRAPGKVQTGVVQNLTESVDVPHTILDVLGAPPLPVQHGQSLRPYLEGKAPDSPRTHVFSEYLENEEAYVRTPTHKLIYGTGKRERTDGYKTDNPTPGPYVRLYDLKADPGEFTDVAGKYPKIVADLQQRMLNRFRTTHAEPEKELDWYLQPRDGERAPA